MRDDGGELVCAVEIPEGTHNKYGWGSREQAEAEIETARHRHREARGSGG
jgi:hypothetical protein